MRKHLLNVAEMRHKAGAFLLDILSAEGDHPIGIPALVCITEPTANPHTGKAGVHNVGIVGGTKKGHPGLESPTAPPPPTERTPAGPTREGLSIQKGGGKSDDVSFREDQNQPSGRYLAVPWIISSTSLRISFTSVHLALTLGSFRKALTTRSRLQLREACRIRSWFST